MYLAWFCLYLFAYGPSLFGQNRESLSGNPRIVGPMKLSCIGGTKVVGEINRWSALSKCPDNYAVTGLQRIDLTGDHKAPNLHVNDFLCDDLGCKAWCIGSSCTVEARCCVIESGLALP